jgi:hypothetical protein
MTFLTGFPDGQGDFRIRRQPAQLDLGLVDDAALRYAGLAIPVTNVMNR